MKDDLFHFLKLHYRPDVPVLLGLSGGPDSLALLYLLLEYRKTAPLQLGIAHVDHAWRPESGEEARQIEELAQQLGLAFHAIRLDPAKLKGNLEAASREERLKFFRALCQEHGYQAVLLGHQADDHAETVLKRVLEGSSLPYLSGLQPVSEVQGVVLWRPLLGIRKKEIIQWLKERKLVPFDDATNRDPRFLRGRFRTEIIPYLAKEFGKEVAGSLGRLGMEALELKEYLESKLEPHFIQGPFGSYFARESLSLFEAKFMLRRLCEQEDCFFTHHLIDSAAQFLLANEANKFFNMGERALVMDRHRAFLLRQPLPALPPLQLLHEGKQYYGMWEVEVTPFKETKILTGWEHVWKGELRIALPPGSYSLGPPQLQASYPGSSPLTKWWTDAKVPAFLRYAAPLVWEGNLIRHEFLTGKQHLREREPTFLLMLKNCS